MQTNVDQVITIIEARKQDVFHAVDNQAKKSLESLSKKKDEVENQVKLIESAVEQTKALVKRSFSTEQGHPATIFAKYLFGRQFEI